MPYLYVACQQTCCNSMWTSVLVLTCFMYVLSWQCIYHWLRSNQQYLTCPICKSGLQMQALRPILDPNAPKEKAQNGIPPRPRPFRKVKPLSNQTDQLPKSISNIGMNVQRGVLLAGYGMFPSMYMGLFHNFKHPQKNQSPFVEKSTQYKLYSVVWKLTRILCLVIFLLILFM